MLSSKFSFGHLGIAIRSPSPLPVHYPPTTKFRAGPGRSVFFRLHFKFSFRLLSARFPSSSPVYPPTTRGDPGRLPGLYPSTTPTPAGSPPGGINFFFKYLNNTSFFYLKVTSLQITAISCCHLNFHSGISASLSGRLLHSPSITHRPPSSGPGRAGRFFSVFTSNFHSGFYPLAFLPPRPFTHRPPGVTRAGSPGFTHRPPRPRPAPRPAE